jgi:hypothetical protein
MPAAVWRRSAALFKPPQMPDVVRTDPKADQAKTETDAAQAAQQARLLQRERRRNSLLSRRRRGRHVDRQTVDADRVRQAEPRGLTVCGGTVGELVNKTVGAVTGRRWPASPSSASPRRRRPRSATRERPWPCNAQAPLTSQRHGARRYERGAVAPVTAKPTLGG